MGKITVSLWAMSDSIDRLFAAVCAAQSADPATSRTAKLMQGGRDKIAKKVAEEAVEVVIDFMRGQTGAVIKESADLVYNLVALWVEAGIEPRQVWAEMDRRERLFGIAEKLPKHLTKPRMEPAPRRRVVALEGRRLRKQR
jgi:phosphoribosyl-ATP pyrophosphohydrolase